MFFVRAADLVRQLQARDTRELGRLQRRLRTCEVLIVDEWGIVPFDRPGGELLFNLISERYERRATVVTTNLAFAECHGVRRGREAHHRAARPARDDATVITTKGKSYRMRKRRGTE